MERMEAHAETPEAMEALGREAATGFIRGYSSNSS
jgi:hypothetical protein